MGLVIVVIFIGAFAVVALVLHAVGSRASQQTKQVYAALDSALATDRTEDHGPVVDLRKSETFSNIPWLNRKLLQFEL